MTDPLPLPELRRQIQQHIKQREAQIDPLDSWLKREMQRVAIVVQLKDELFKNIGEKL
jgi:ferritin-like metal-binding protein YciE